MTKGVTLTRLVIDLTCHKGGIVGANTVLDIYKRRDLVRRLYIQGNPLSSIAKIIGAPLSNVKEDVQFIQAAWREAGEVEWSEHVSRQLARLDMLEQQAWSAWESSQCEENQEVLDFKDMTSAGRKAVKTALGKGGAVSATFNWTVKKSRNRGNAQFLNVILSVIRERSKLLGLDKINTDDGAVDDVPIIAVVATSSDDIDQMQDAQSFLAINAVKGDGEG